MTQWLNKNILAKFGKKIKIHRTRPNGVAEREDAKGAKFQTCREETLVQGDDVHQWRQL